jgi:hypothetical protein
VGWIGWCGSFTKPTHTDEEQKKSKREGKLGDRKKGSGKRG